MRNQTRELYNQYLEDVAEINGVNDASQKFSVAPSVTQTLENHIQESSEFLKMINVVGVTELKGEKLGLGVGGPIAGTNDTSGTGARQPRDLSTLDVHSYECTKTNFDTYIPYAKLDMWGKFPDFQTRIRNLIIRRQALDRIMIGWNGTSRATTSNPTTNPLLQDVNVGWLQKMRTENPARVMKEVTAGSNKITIGEGKNYNNLDALVFNIVNEMLEPWYQEATDLVAIVGRKLMSDKLFPLINKDQAPSEQKAMELIISQKRLGGLQAVRVPYFPDNAILVTRLDNLSIYWQEGARRRHLKDVPERDRIENYESDNEAYVIEDLGCACMAEHIELSA